MWAGLVVSSSGIQSLLDSLEKLSPRLEGRKDDLEFLQNLVSSNEFHSLMQVDLLRYFTGTHWEACAWL